MASSAESASIWWRHHIPFGVGDICDNHNGVRPYVHELWHHYYGAFRHNFNKEIILEIWYVLFGSLLGIWELYWRIILHPVLKNKPTPQTAPPNPHPIYIYIYIKYIYTYKSRGTFGQSMTNNICVIGNPKFGFLVHFPFAMGDILKMVPERQINHNFGWQCPNLSSKYTYIYIIKNDLFVMFMSVLVVSK